MDKRVSEHEIQSQILEWLKGKGIFHWRNNTGAMKGSHKGKSWFVRFGVKGAPDIFAVRKGHLIGIEVKRPGEGLSGDQQNFMDLMRSAGASYYIARSLEDLTTVLEMLEL